jgi:hypothetical protein
LSYGETIINKNPNIDFSQNPYLECSSPHKLKMVREYFRGGFPKDCGWAVSDDDGSTEEDPEDDVDEDSIPTPQDDVEEDDVDEVTAPEDHEDEMKGEEGPSIGVPLYASAPSSTGKRDHEDEGFPAFLKKARLERATLGFLVEPSNNKVKKNSAPSYTGLRDHGDEGFPAFLKKAVGLDIMDLPLFKELPFKKSRRGLDQIELPKGCEDWNMAFNVAMDYVDCPLCSGWYVECPTCGRHLE